jgi:hypothetical protein
VSISEVFIRRPIATSLLMAGILIFGIVSYELLPVSDDTVERRAVQVAMTEENRAVIEKGLARDERVVVDGQYRLTEGVEVNLRQGDNANAMAEKP